MPSEAAASDNEEAAPPAKAARARTPRKPRVKPGPAATEAAATPGRKRVPMVPVTAEHPDLAKHLEPLGPGFVKEAESKLGQAIPRVRAVNPSDVAPIHCRVFFKADLKTGRNGVMEVTMQVPWEYRDRAIDMVDLAGHPVELYMRPCARR